jgi:hypothetical protein
MGILAETAIVNHRSSFANKGKKFSVFRFRVQQTNGSLLFPFFCSKQTEVAIFRSFRFPFAEFRKHGGKETSKHGDINQKTEAQGIFLNPFCHLSVLTTNKTN